MSSSDPIHSRNLLLGALSAADQARLAPHFERVAVEREQVLVTPGEPIRHIYFMEGGIASIISLSAESGRTEIGIFGREGFSGFCLLLGADRSPHETFIQVDHTHALRIGAAAFTEAVEESATLRRMLLRFVHTQFVQTGQSAVANARHQIESRLARWLLMCRDRADSDEIALTHEFMAIMIGAQRSGVTVALHILEGTGMIRSTRKRVIILDRDKLEELAGESYGLAEAEYRRLISPFGRRELESSERRQL
ncbi:MAG: Crp/Fnr family transcriptional regulator [Methylobacterium mesophilicum]|nr:Crp/Fnr family transcriptional regulator [Methylobacterium mesophilicum]